MELLVRQRTGFWFISCVESFETNPIISGSPEEGKEVRFVQESNHRTTGKFSKKTESYQKSGRIGFMKSFPIS